MPTINPISLFLAVICLIIGFGLIWVNLLALGIVFFVLAAIIVSSLKMANAWEKFVILRAGSLFGVKGPGLFFIVPMLDAIPTVIEITMNIIYETTKERGTTILLPTSMLDSMNAALPVAVSGLATESSAAVPQSSAGRLAASVPQAGAR